VNIFINIKKNNLLALVMRIYLHHEHNDNETNIETTISWLLVSGEEHCNFNFLVTHIVSVDQVSQGKLH